MRILLIDDDEIVLELLQCYLEEELPEAEVTPYPALERGRPSPDFDWSAYDILLLDYHLGHGETGVAWLHAFGSTPGFPRTILITNVDDPYIVSSVIQVGAQGYINKADLTPERLAETIHDVHAGELSDKTEPPPRVENSSLIQKVADQVEQEIVDVVLEATRRTLHGVAQHRCPANSTYKFGQLIARGGMGSVYMAERVEDGVTVVVKILERSALEDTSTLQRFIQEGELVKNLNSPYVVKVFDQGFTNSYAYIAMEFFGRGDLKQRIDLGVSEEDAITYLYNIARGLEAIHRVGIVHRDLKPANVMFRTDDSMALADFGIAKQIESDLGLTIAGSIVGTPHYLAPEQADDAPVDPRFDLYSAGILLYELLTGNRPYEGSSISAVIFQHKYAAIPTLEGPLARYQPLLELLMAKDPKDRCQSASQLCQALSVVSFAA
jgi:DNA-binding NarL/FixJ family response regulator